MTKMSELYYPLATVDYTSVSASQNVDVWTEATYLIDQTTSAKYGIPADGNIGLTVSGQVMYPVYNNNGQYTPAKCEVDSCNEHVGQGGGQPHLHGDPFSDQKSGYNCLYGPSNYTNGATGHPPVIGFANDGHLIYGRYLDTTAPGFGAPFLDVCGGHAHTTAGDDENGMSLQTYHYHTQVFLSDKSIPTCVTETLE